MTTWKGCGRHVDAVMSKVPEEKRCVCKDAAAAPNASNTAATGGTSAGSGGGGRQ